MNNYSRTHPHKTRLTDITQLIVTGMSGGLRDLIQFDGIGKLAMQTKLILF